jgi:hypothetical protein
MIVLWVFVGAGRQLLDRDAERADAERGSGAAEADPVEALESLDLIDPDVR